MKYETAGDPITGLKWTRKTTTKISQELSLIGIEVSPRVVARLLQKMDFSLKTCRKNIESGFKPQPGYQKKRDAQFKYISKMRNKFSRRDQPVISIDAKKKEQVGNFKNNGRTWRKAARNVNDHDFPSDAEGRALPYGIYDTRKNMGCVYVGTSRETPEFAVDAVRQWLQTEGRKRYKHATEVLILADCGGGNSARSHVWKYDLQRKVCDKNGLTVTVCHYPPGASKWNPIEHRLFSEISKNWSGIPLEDYATILNYLRTTKTSFGLKVRASLLTKQYKKGRKVPPAEMKSLALIRHKEQPEWNYTIRPR